MVKKTGDTIGVRLEKEDEKKFEVILQRGDFKRRSDLMRYLIKVGLEVVGYFERHKITDTNDIKETIEKEFGKRQLNLPFDKK